MFPACLGGQGCMIFEQARAAHFNIQGTSFGVCHCFVKDSACHVSLWKWSESPKKYDVSYPSNGPSLLVSPMIIQYRQGGCERFWFVDFVVTSDWNDRAAYAWKDFVNQPRYLYVDAQPPFACIAPCVDLLIVAPSHQPHNNAKLAHFFLNNPFCVRSVQNLMIAVIMYGNHRPSTTS